MQIILLLTEFVGLFKCIKLHWKCSSWHVWHNHLQVIQTSTQQLDWNPRVSFFLSSVYKRWCEEDTASESRRICISALSESPVLWRDCKQLVCLVQKPQHNKAGRADRDGGERARPLPSVCPIHPLVKPERHGTIHHTLVITHIHSALNAHPCCSKPVWHAFVKYGRYYLENTIFHASKMQISRWSNAYDLSTIFQVFWSHIMAYKPKFKVYYFVFCWRLKVIHLDQHEDV